MEILKDGLKQTIHVHWKDHWKVVFLPLFSPPSYLDGRPYTEGIFAHQAAVITVSNDARLLAQSIRLTMSYTPRVTL